MTDKILDQELSLEKFLVQAVGLASMCWKEVEGEGRVFMNRKAGQVIDELVERVNTAVESGETAKPRAKSVRHEIAGLQVDTSYFDDGVTPRFHWVFSPDNTEYPRACIMEDPKGEGVIRHIMDRPEEFRAEYEALLAKS